VTIYKLDRPKNCHELLDQSECNGHGHDQDVCMDGECRNTAKYVIEVSHELKMPHGTTEDMSLQKM